MSDDELSNSSHSNDVRSRATPSLASRSDAIRAQGRGESKKMMARAVRQGRRKRNFG